jgi:hypothetical protein
VAVCHGTRSGADGLNRSFQWVNWPSCRGPLRLHGSVERVQRVPYCSDCGAFNSLMHAQRSGFIYKASGFMKTPAWVAGPCLGSGAGLGL